MASYWSRETREVHVVQVGAWEFDYPSDDDDDDQDTTMTSAIDAPESLDDVVEKEEVGKPGNDAAKDDAPTCVESGAVLSSGKLLSENYFGYFIAEYF